MKAYLLLAILETCVLVPGFAQQETNNWFFGYNAGLNFGTGIPVVTPGSLRSWEGCSSISDRNGQLLFYTDGITVWNKNHLIMPNGQHLAGDTLCTQSALITGYPGNDHLYYVFTVAKETEPNGLRYSLVDMRLNGGLGDVVAGQKNIPLLTPVCEKVAAVKHRNANDIWVITHYFGTNQFYVYSITCRGLNTTPVISAAGNVADRINNTIGYLKASPDGNTLAMAGFTSVVEVFNFNALTGQVSNPRVITGNPNNITGPYGVEFSGNSKLLYVSESYNNNASGEFYIFQYNLDYPNIVDSRTAIDSGYDHAAGALQLASDNKIYIAYDRQAFIGVIDEPDMEGPGCGHLRQAVNLPGAIISGVGLPAAVAGYQRTLLGKDTTVCEGQRVVSRVSLPGTTFLWQDGSTLDSLVIQTPGPYWVQINYNNCTYRDTLQVNWRPRPIINLGKDTTLCEEESWLIDISHAGDLFSWQDGSDLPIYQVKEKGTYHVVVTKNGCTGKDTVIVDYRFKPRPNLGPDREICTGREILLDPGLHGIPFTWQNGSTQNTFLVTKPGVYSVSVDSECGLVKEEVVISKGSCRLAIPNAFTPGRTQNRLFRVINGDGLKQFTLQVYNRWGQLLFRSSDPARGWDGSLGSVLQPSGTYIYMVSYLDEDTGKNVLHKGFVTLIR